ncbi:MAG: PilT/PilU family type 4a pilus ATPase [Xanthomonadales bacterium]|jgi:twitching motility protein PilU|nr:PilT/PilU family type 4a pilus ATPase [Xanthomonadales bacterium]
MNNVQAWLRKLHEDRGSDLFVTAGVPPCIKVHGKIQPITDRVLGDEDTKEVVVSLMSPDQRKEFDETRECQFAVALDDSARFRVSAFYQQHRVGMVCRRIETRIPTFDQLDLPDTLQDLALTKRGIIIMVGATGTGKSTTLAAMLGYRNQSMTGHIITVEDPIEYVHHHAKSIITQREVGIDTDSFEVALRNTLRQAPDVILIGEVRTREAMEHAIAFAETGHLCLTTLHANNANQAMDRILHFFPEDQRDQVLLDLSFNLRGVVAQQLLPSVDGRRRHIVLEILLNTPLVQEKIRKGDIHEIKPIMKESNHHGMVTFDQSLVRLYQEGCITYKDALRHADSPNEVRLAIKLAQGGNADSLMQGMDGIEVLDTD